MADVSPEYSAIVDLLTSSDFKRGEKFDPTGIILIDRSVLLSGIDLKTPVQLRSTQNIEDIPQLGSINVAVFTPGNVKSKPNSGDITQTEVEAGVFERPPHGSEELDGVNPGQRILELLIPQAERPGILVPTGRSVIFTPAQ